MNYRYEDAVNRAESLRGLIPESWRVVPIGNAEDGYRLALRREDEPGDRLYLASDDDVRRLVETYVQQIETVAR